MDTAQRYFAMGVGNMVYANCDFFLKKKLPLTSLALNRQPQRNMNFTLNLAYKKFTVVMPFAQKHYEYIAPNIPKGLQGRIIGVGIKEGQLLLGVKDVTISRLNRKISFEDHEFEPIESAESLRQRLDVN